MKKTLLAASIVLICSTVIAQCNVLSKRCRGCGSHLYNQTPIESCIVDTDSWHITCIESREFDDKTVWKEKYGPALPMQDFSKIWFYDNPHEINPYALDK